MDHITIPIPDGIDAKRKAEIAEWLTDLARQVTADVPSIDEDSAVREEAVNRIKLGMADAEAGRYCDSTQAKKRIAERLGPSSND